MSSWFAWLFYFSFAEIFGLREIYMQTNIATETFLPVNKKIGWATIITSMVNKHKQIDKPKHVHWLLHK